MTFLYTFSLKLPILKNIDQNKILINRIDKKIIKCNDDNKKLLNDKNKINSSNNDIKIKKKQIKKVNLLIRENINTKNKLLNDLNEIKKKNSEYYEKIKKNNSENDSYYILTSCYKMSNEDLIKIYIKRWGVETNFRFLKSNFKFDKINSLNIDTIKKNLYSCQFLFIIESLIDYITPNEFINKNDIVSNILGKVDIKNLVITNEKKPLDKNKTTEKKNTNKSVTLNLIGNHLLKNLFITKIKKKDKKDLYKIKCNKENKLLISKIKSVLENTMGLEHICILTFI